MKKTLSAKEELFCTYYVLDRNGREAAAKSGYRSPQRSAAKLLKKKEILAFIKAADEKAKRKSEDIAAGYYRLAFGCVADAVKLIFCDEISESELEKADLFSVSEIKRQKGGGIEIKFFDRLKALEKLESLSLSDSNASAKAFYSAIEKGAIALREEENE
ncbi:MAG: terminase small subunit [Clostridia bacterium]|nr:terminase small subunit [Clostridia bacterium]